MSLGDEGSHTAERYSRKGKRKMNEDDAEASIPSPEPTARQRLNIQRLLNTAAPLRPLFFGSFVPVPEPESVSMRPFSFGRLSNGAFLPAAEPPTIYFPSSLPPTTGQQIDQIIASNDQNLRNALYDTVEKQAEELAAKLIHEKEMEINAKIIENVTLDENLEHYKGQIVRLLPHSKNWGTTVSHLRKKLREVKETYPNLDMGEKNTGESSHVNIGKIDPVMLNCMVCKKFVANIMMWTCRHVCVCSECDEVSPLCPMCGIPKISTVEVCIPTYD